MDKLRKGWEIKSLGEIATISSGGTPSRNNMEYWKNGKIPWIRTTEVQNCILNEEDVQEFITEKGLKNSSAKLVPAGTILLAMIGQGKTRGQVAYLTFEASTNQNCATISFRREYDSKFYFQYLLSKYESIRGMSNSAGQSNLSGALVKSIKVPVPPLPEQIKIAEILSTWDNAIQTTEKQLTNSQQQKKALMQMLLSGEKRFAEFSGEWGKIKIKELLLESKITDNVTNSAEKRLTVRLNLKGIEHRIFRGTEARNATLHFVRKAGQFIYGKQNFHKGAFGIIPVEFDNFESSQDIPTFDFTEKVVPMWFYHFCSQELFYTGIENRMTGTGSKRLNPKDFLDIEILVPNLKEQQKIAEILTTADQEIETLQKKLEYLKLEKRALMQRLLL